MKKFEYKITDEVGIHARPAGLLVKFAKQYTSDIQIECNGKSASAKALMAIMGLGASQGANVTVSVSGDDEDVAFEALQKYMSENL